MISFDYRTAITLDPVLARKQIIDVYYHRAQRNTALTARLCGISRKTAYKYLKQNTVHLFHLSLRFFYLVYHTFSSDPPGVF
jgi:DNA-binding CsgD family transcriptional regulator